MAPLSALRIEPLPRDRGLARLVARWQFAEWGHLSGPLAERTAALEAQMGRRAVPCTLVAWMDGAAVGSVSLIVDDLPGRPEWNPWLASVVVVPAWRGRGIGAALCREAAALAERLGFPSLYLFTSSHPAFYARLGWRALERAGHRGEQVTVMRIALRYA